MNKWIFFIFWIFLFGCSYSPISKLDVENVNSLKSKSIVDLTDVLDFNAKDSLVILDSSFLIRISYLILESRSMKFRIVYMAKHEDRLYLSDLQYKAEQVKDYFIKTGINNKKIEAEVGLDFQMKYPEFGNSSIVLVVD